MKSLLGFMPFWAFGIYRSLVKEWHCYSVGVFDFGKCNPPVFYSNHLILLFDIYGARLTADMRQNRLDDREQMKTTRCNETREHGTQYWMAFSHYLVVQ
jgi:hypothetical protein